MFERDLDDVMERAEKVGLEFTRQELERLFGVGTYRWTIIRLGVDYGTGMEIGLFDLHQNYTRETAGLPPYEEESS